MKNYFSLLNQAFCRVYERKEYYLYSLVAAMVVFSVHPLLQNYQLLRAEFTWLLALRLIIASPMISSISSFITLIIISLLSGIVMTFSLYLIKRQIKQGVNVGIAGTIIGILAPACPSCALGLLGIMSMGGLIAVLPFKGLEFGLLGIVLLAISVVYLSKKIETDVCAFKKR